ncbi:uncharacterized protein LOC135479285 [Liolophura sinensis]|uniref:uncharacterized protein LOC135479285 n=1 Tax=Liolophura sinensis TaxID=3198878 RepID=UPI0031586BCE
MRVRELVSAVLGLSLCFPPEILVHGRPDSDHNEAKELRRLENTFYQFALRQYPEQATLYNQHQHDDKLEEFTMEAFRNRKLECDVILESANHIDPSKLSYWDRKDLKILKLSLETFIEGYQWKSFGNLNTITFLGGVERPPSWARSANFEDQSDYEKYLKRLQAFPVQIDQRITLMRLAIKLNRTSHKVSLGTVPRHLYDHHRMIYYSPLQYQPRIIPDSVWSSIFNRASKLIDHDIKAAYEKLQNFLTGEYLPVTRPTVGVFSWHRGKEYYRACLQWHVGVDVSPEEVHNLGLSEVERIQRQIRDNVMKKIQFEGSLGEFFTHVQTIPRYLNHSAAYLLEEYKNIVHVKIQKKLFKLFKYIYVPKIRIVQLFHDGPWGSYGGNTFFVNLLEPETRSTLMMLPLALHEVNPGHHFQVAYANMHDVPKYRGRNIYGDMSAVPFVIPAYQVYIEGWALYAEYLGEEMGLFENPYYLYGRYMSEIFRACRLVVDTGIHAFGWTRQRAIDYIANHTIFPIKQIQIEVDRYITWPAQSVAYKLGEMKIKELRRKAETELGNQFDIKEFHDQVLKHGRVPMVILEETINDWIKSFTGERTNDFEVNYHFRPTQNRCSQTSRKCDIFILISILVMAILSLRI